MCGETGVTEQLEINEFAQSQTTDASSMDDSNTEELRKSSEIDCTVELEVGALIGEESHEDCDQLDGRFGFAAQNTLHSGRRNMANANNFPEKSFDSADRGVRKRKPPM
ncbi:unnamed protein product [Soboliphyme baturini]|uniref:Uncharacterized protein n=1 Tax=Soboliphyme baturini TaxID=241478 RepID=A0A183IZW3_9BILA|nr:unnamed protein product [Soboliphyme baturini]